MGAVKLPPLPKKILLNSFESHCFILCVRFPRLGTIYQISLKWIPKIIHFLLEEGGAD